MFATASSSSAQTNLPIYTDRLVAFQDWGWGTHNFANTTPVFSGSDSASFTGTAWNVACGLHHDVDASLYTSFSFWAHGGASGGQVLRVYVHEGGADQPPTTLTALPANAWKQFVISMATLHAANTNVDQFTIQLTSNGTTNTFYLDEIQLIARPVPSPIHLAVNATQSLR